MDIKKTATITLSEKEICKIIAEHLNNTTEYKVKPDEVHFALGNEPNEFGGNPTPYLKGCDITVKI